MTLHCVRAQLLIERRKSGLDESDRLVLEEHLEHCAECAAEANALDVATKLLGEGFELSPARRERLLANALSGRHVDAARGLPRARRPFVLIAAAGLAFAIGVVYMRGASIARPPLVSPSPRVFFDAARIGDRVLGGQLNMGDERLASGAALTQERVFSTDSGAEVRVAHARVKLGADTRGLWDAAHATFSLERGSVHVEVDPRPMQPFAVQTPRFRVEVKGTVFDVETDSVRVSQGRVLVLSEGQVRAELAAGERWSSDEVAAATPRPASGRERVDVNALLAHARARLAASDAKSAQRDLGIALAAHPTPAEDAEARSLLAECALVSGDPSEAQRRYSDVAREHAGSAAAETATFAAARLERDPARQASLFRDYIAKYPKGRFANEARARLQSLGK